MKTKYIILLTSLACSAMAQDNYTEAPAQGDHAPRHQSMIAAALDTNKDGIIDAAELANATAALKAMDKNGNGQLEMSEVLPRLRHSPEQPLVPPAHARPPVRAGSGAGTASAEVPPPHAAPGQAPVPPRRPSAPPIPALIAALDTNQDGVIDAAELAKAPAALKALDKNGDGQLTPDEYQPEPVKERKALRHARTDPGQPQHGPRHQPVAPPQQ